MERDTHVTLVLEVEKHECLYNSTLPEYARKEVTDQAWSEVSKVIQLPVPECKDKWRNIRSTFRRSLKPSKNSKPKRTYYLSRYLNFIVPYTKPLEDTFFRDETSSQDNDSSLIIKEENSGDSNCDQNQIEPQESTSGQDHEDTEDDKTDDRSLSNGYSSEEDFSMPEHLKTKQKANKLLYKNEKEEHMRYFFLSLLPEFGDMTEQQTRTFKINVLQLIDEIKNGRSNLKASRVKAARK